MKVKYEPRLALFLSLLVLPFGLRAQPSSSEPTAFEKQCDELASQTGNDAKRLHDLFNTVWSYTMRESPEFATEVGYPGQNDRWSDDSLAAIARRKREVPAPGKVLATIDRASLNTD